MYSIKGGKKLSGLIEISGAKNAALPIIVASLLADGETVLTNVPDLQDIRTIIKVIEYLGAETDYNNKIDIWSIGIIIYFLICGYLPFNDEGNNFSRIANDITKGAIKYDERIWNKISLQGIDIVEKCLERDLNKRLNIKEFLKHPWFSKNKKYKNDIKK